MIGPTIGRILAIRRGYSGGTLDAFVEGFLKVAQARQARQVQTTRQVPQIAQPERLGRPHVKPEDDPLRYIRPRDYDVSAFEPYDSRRYPVFTGSTPDSFLQALRTNPEGITTTARRLYDIAYRGFAGNQLELSREYRKQNPQLRDMWGQSLDDAHLDGGTAVILPDDHIAQAAGQYRTSTGHVTINPHRPVNGRWYTALHEMMHRLQHFGGRVVGRRIPRDDTIVPEGTYVAGLEPTVEQFNVAFRSGEAPTDTIDTANAAYFLHPAETEAHLMDGFRRWRISKINEVIARGGTAEDVNSVLGNLQAPGYVEKWLEDQMHNWAPVKFREVFKALSPDQQKRFIEYWSKLIPGLVSNTPHNRAQNVDSRYYV